MENIFSTITKDNIPLWCRELVYKYSLKQRTYLPILFPGIAYAFFRGILVRIYILSTVILINAS